MMSSIQSLAQAHDFILDEIGELNKAHIFTRWDWDYEKALEFQESCVQYIKENPSERIFIICNHPNCFTYGRGLQRNKEVLGLGLKEFDWQNAQLPFPLFKISRGGGLTFHHPGQYIVYPIMKLNNDKHTMKKIMFELLHLAQAVLQENYTLEDLTTDNPLLGLWRSDKKIASIGLALERFITFHGMAVNINSNEQMSKVLSSLNPCGISGESYICAQEVLGKKIDIKEFHNHFLKRLRNSFLVS